MGIDRELYEYSVGQSKGSIFINNINQTDSRCNNRVGLTMGNYIVCNQRFSNFRNLLNGLCDCIFLQFITEKLSYIENINFINNTSIQSIYRNSKIGLTTYDKCFFKDNTCKYIISCYSSVLKIANMYIENLSQISGIVSYSNTKSAEDIPIIILLLDEDVCLRTNYPLSLIHI